MCVEYSQKKKISSRVGRHKLFNVKLNCTIVYNEQKYFFAFYKIF